jgi:hypothetical protein
MEMVYKNNLTNGFFLEAGAQNCEWSVTLPLEANFGWTGIRNRIKVFHKNVSKGKGYLYFEYNFFLPLIKSNNDY